MAQDFEDLTVAPHERGIRSARTRAGHVLGHFDDIQGNLVVLGLRCYVDDGHCCLNCVRIELSRHHSHNHKQ